MDKTDADVSGYVKDCKKSFLHLPHYTDCPYYVFVRKSLSFYHAMVRQKNEEVSYETESARCVRTQTN